MLAAVLGVSFVVFFALLIQFFGCYAINYKVTPEKLKIVLFGRFTVFSLLLTNVVEARQITLLQAVRPHFKTIRFGNRLYGNIVEIRYHSGIFTRILVTPANPQTFINELNKHAVPKK